MNKQRSFQMHAATWAAVNGFLFLIWLVTTPGGFPWFVFPAGGWGIALAIHAVATFGNPGDDEEELDAGPSHRALPGERHQEPLPREDPSKYRTLGQ